MRNKALLFCLLIFSCGGSDLSSIQDKVMDVRYGEASEAQALDVLMPVGNGPFPAVVLIHGGGFRYGDKKAEYALAKKLVAAGYVAVPVNYRLSGEATFPAAVHDVKAAIRFVKANADQYAIDSTSIATWGASAGGNLSAMMGTSAGVALLEGNVGSHSGISTRIQACVDWFGPISFANMIEEARQLGFKTSFDVAIESQYIGAEASDPANADLVQRANPTNYIDENDPPFFIQVGSKDPLVPYTQSQYFADALGDVLGPEKVYYELIEGGKHGGSKFNNDENIKKVIAFLDQHLKN